MNFTQQPDGTVTVDEWTRVMPQLDFLRAIPGGLQEGTNTTWKDGIVYVTLEAANGKAEYKLEGYRRGAVLVRRWAVVNA